MNMFRLSHQALGVGFHEEIVESNICAVVAQECAIFASGCAYGHPGRLDGMAFQFIRVDFGRFQAADEPIAVFSADGTDDGNLQSETRQSAGGDGGSSADFTLEATCKCFFTKLR